MAVFRAAAPDQALYLDELVDAGLVVPSGVPGVYGRAAAFEEVRNRFDALVGRVAAPDGAEALRFPPVLPREQLESTGYLKSFPHLAGSVFAFEGTEAQAAEQHEAAGRHEDWGAHQRMTDLVLMPAACYPVYPAVAARGQLPEGGVTVDAGGAYVFRHEPSGDPARLQMFHMRELVRIAEPATVLAWREAWRDRALALLRGIGLDADFDVAADPFFGRTGRMLAASQREQALKFEILVHIAGPQPTAVASFNYHEEHFGQRSMAWRLAGGDVAHTACLGFGHERIVLALFRTHGLEPSRSGQRRSARSCGRRERLRAADRPPCLASTPRSTARTRCTPESAPMRETNCYADILIELLHARGDEPLAAMGFLGEDGLRGRPVDLLQAAAGGSRAASSAWTSTRCSPTVHCPSRSRPRSPPGRTMIVELDSWYLPDTASTSYRTRARQDLRGRWRGSIRRPVSACATSTTRASTSWTGEDYRGVFRLDGEDLSPRTCCRPTPSWCASMPGLGWAARSCAEASQRAPGPPSVASAGRRALSRASARQLAAELPRLLAGDAGDYHAYAFATVRMAGSAFEIAASHVEWLLGDEGRPAVEALARIVESCKVLSFRLARRRAFDPGATVAAQAQAWSQAMAALDAIVG